MSTCKNCKGKCKQGRSFCDDCLLLIDKLDFEEINAERKWIEELFVGRFNNFLLVFSLIVTASFANSFTSCKSLVFYFGAGLLAVCCMPLCRAYHKYDNAVRIILSQEDFRGKQNPIKIIEDLYMRRRGNRFKSIVVSKWLAYYIPILCITFLILIGLGVDFKLIK